MLSEIQARINRQGWRVTQRPADEAHPRIDHKKRRIHVGSDLELAKTYFELRGWPAPEDFASTVAQSRAIENILVEGNSSEKVEYPQAQNSTDEILLGWVKEKRADLIEEIEKAHLSETDAALLAARIRNYQQKPELCQKIKVTSRLRSR